MPKIRSVQSIGLPFRSVQSMGLPFHTSPVETPLGLQGTHNRTYKPPTWIQIGENWREIQGANDWNGLLEPGKLDERLRNELIRYGQFAEVAYDAFDFDKYSQYCGSCRYSKENLFKEVDLHNTGYTVTGFIYATADVEVLYWLRKSEREDAWSSKSNWIGYVAVCTDKNEIERLGRRDILVVWRGTVTGLEWTANLKYKLIPCALTDEQKHGSAHIKVEKGFFSLYTASKEDSKFNKISAQSYLLQEMKYLIGLYKDHGELSITLCGHSLGSALATLSAYDLAQSYMNEIEVGGKKVTIPITVFSYGGPRVGNNAFKTRVEELGVKILRVKNKGDVVPHVLGIDLLDHAHIPKTYAHVGVELAVNDKDSKHLNQKKAAVWSSLHNLGEILKKQDFTPLSVQHNLEVYLHLIDGYGRYNDPPSRDPVLVNKSCGFLLDDKFVPESWWQPRHKGLRYSALENRYYQRDRAVEDIPVPPKLEMVNAAKDLKKTLALKKSLEEGKGLEEDSSLQVMPSREEKQCLPRARAL